ncbi:MAG TPA: hypothetical protein VIK72_06605 [Clostridiaceae bacterium]
MNPKEECEVLFSKESNGSPYLRQKEIKTYLNSKHRLSRYYYKI